MAKTARRNPPDRSTPVIAGRYSAETPLVLQLYLADSSTVSLLAGGNLAGILRLLPPASYQLEIIDALADPSRAVRDGVLLTPTLRKLAPAPAIMLLGDLHDRRQLLHLLGLPEDDL